ncbi:hypothetical protein DRQ17_07590 [bacterium]|nr:MAG: hypothetical protein DRQ17_07590 [bacterium]
MVYSIPIRRKVLPAPRGLRTKRALGIIRKFVKRHTKTEKVKISPDINTQLHSSGVKLPGKLKVRVLIEEDTATVNLFTETLTKEQPKEEPERKSEKEESPKENQKETNPKDNK